MSASLVVTTRDGMCWTRREATRDGQALYALADVPNCPEFLMETWAELAKRGIASTADVLPGPDASTRLFVPALVLHDDEPETGDAS